MRLILLSGGSGKRLWPLSNDSRSKQFLKVLMNENGEYESMIQRVWKQLKAAELSDYSVIATSATQKEIITSQLQEEVKIVVEPERRDTFPAIALASLFLYETEQIDMNEIITILPVDPFVEPHFFQVIKSLEEALIKSQADLALIGVVPTYPSEKYGYIIPKCKSDNGYFEVNAFKEKPQEQEAIKLIAEDAFWNCGVFSFKLKYIFDVLQKRYLPTSYNELLRVYNQLPKISFDYEVVENAKQIIVLPYEGYWKDLGTWNTLTEELGDNIIGRGIISNTPSDHNNHLINELDIPVAIMGLDNVVVAVSPDGVLVSSKEASPNVKGIANEFENRLMYEEKSWGWYRVLDYFEDNDGMEVLSRKVYILAGERLDKHHHDFREEHLTITSGKGEIHIDKKKTFIKSGDSITIPKGIVHSIESIENLQFIEVQIGKRLSEDDNYLE